MIFACFSFHARHTFAHIDFVNDMSKKNDTIHQRLSSFFLFLSDKSCDIFHRIGYGNDIPRYVVGDKHETLCTIPYPKQGVCCDGQLSKVEMYLAEQMPSMRVINYVPLVEYVCYLICFELQ